MMETKKPFWKSKTKIAAILIAVGPAIAVIGGMIAGDVSIIAGLEQLLVPAGIIAGIFGIRDLPFVNRTK